MRKFLEQGRRGALITNTEFQNEIPAKPGHAQPTFDWVTIEDLQPTMDQRLQESVICYNPRVQVVVLTFLLSKSGNSMAVWRTKLSIPESIQKGRKKEIDEVMAFLDAKPRDKAHVDVYVFRSTFSD